MAEAETYVELDQDGVRRHLARRPALTARLGGEPGAWSVHEVSDGNLNSVFLVEGPAGGLCVKQSLPHVRVDTSWKLPLDRAFFEAAYMRAVAPHVGAAIPALLDYDGVLFCLVMERLSPHLILRRGLIARRRYPRMAADVAIYVARACFATSGLGRRFEAVMDDIALFAKNQTLTRITVDLVLADPYRVASRNRWTTPWLDAAASDIRHDTALKQAAARMGERFLGSPQALLHGDLHSGSVMVTAEETRIIDGEFALMGPIGFDLGLFVGNLLLSLFAMPGHDEADATGYRDWITRQIETVWQVFDSEFRRLWDAAAAGGAGDVLPASLSTDPVSRRALQDAWLAAIYDDMLGFAGMEMIRRILGFAHVLDLESIASDRQRAECELAALALARRLLVERSVSAGIGTLLRQTPWSLRS
nr:S-methyl-5-thioribose kinase [uncultured Lichenicoccus sp.]